MRAEVAITMATQKTYIDRRFVELFNERSEARQYRIDPQKLLFQNPIATLARSPFTNGVVHPCTAVPDLSPPEFAIIGHSARS
jgi:hypothetical protein